MTTVALFGNCQVEGLARCLKAMSPGLTVRPFSWRSIRNGTRRPSEILSKCDVVLLQDTGGRHFSEFEADLRSDATIVKFPTVYFTAFHPDFVYATSEGRPIGSPLGNMSSGICLFAWKNGFGVDDALRLFSEEVYSEIGYLDHWDPSYESLIGEARRLGLSLEGEVHHWLKSGCFMHMPNHPKLIVLAGLARAVHELLGWKPEVRYPENLIVDELAGNAVWPLYPGIAEKYGLRGEYIFKPAGGKMRGAGIGMSLEAFVEGSYRLCNDVGLKNFKCRRTDHQAMQRLLKFRMRAPEVRTSNPYQGLPSHRFWKRAVASLESQDVDPVVRPRFTMERATKVATAGSCFAQHMARTLRKAGLGYYVAESGDALPHEEALRRNYGVFSARYGNIYTARQLRQLIDRAYGLLEPEDVAWERSDGRLVDPFRPQIEPDGFATVSDVEVARREHFHFVRKMFEQLDVFVFTLGLTEAWRSKRDGAVFPLAPGVAGGAMDSARYEFVNFTAGQTTDDLAAFVRSLRAINPAAKVVLTVSPVPLIATYEDQHVLVSTAYSKAALRVAANEVRNAHDWVDYFPSYEIITGSFNRGAYFEEDLRSISEEGVGHVMRVLLKHYFPASQALDGFIARSAVARDLPSRNLNESLAEELAAGREIVCEEEEIERTIVAAS